MLGIFLDGLNFRMEESETGQQAIRMSASMYIVVEGEDPGFDIFVNGRTLARNEDALEKMAVLPTRTVAAAVPEAEMPAPTLLAETQPIMLMLADTEVV